MEPSSLQAVIQATLLATIKARLLKTNSSIGIRLVSNIEAQEVQLSINSSPVELTKGRTRWRWWMTMMASMTLRQSMTSQENLSVNPIKSFKRQTQLQSNSKHSSRIRERCQKLHKTRLQHSQVEASSSRLIHASNLMPHLRQLLLVKLQMLHLLEQRHHPKQHPRQQKNLSTPLRKISSNKMLKRKRAKQLMPRE